MPIAPAGRTSAPQSPPSPSPERLAVNLRVLAQERPDLAKKIAETPADPSLEFLVAPDGALTATRDGRALASKRRPREEAKRVADALDIREHAVFVVMGFGLGHHVRAIADRLGASGMICVFEPDLALLRAVLERVDCTAWFAKSCVILFDAPEDIAAISRSAAGREGTFGLGVRFVEHGPSAARLGESAARFSDSFAQAVAAVRTSVITTMVQTEVTVRNGLMNAEHYIAGAGAGDEGIRDLENLCAGRPAIVVSAGPSLRKNIALLRDPAVREKCVVIAVQTVLKTLLAEGIQPHFVCALDYHEISKRFYDDLDPADVANVTLVAEGKVNAAVLDAYPGPVRMPSDPILDSLLPPELRGDHGAIRAGSTVAHLCYYLARHLGCDPVILTGQDLAFTDGVYYGQGAAIHHVWAPELGPFRTLEMMEWERIARAKASLRPVVDHDGRRLYTDEQMATYRVQFERTFAEDAERGLRVIDATEGGARKAGAEAVALREALDRYAGHDAPALPEIPVPPRRTLATPQRAALSERFSELRRQIGRVELLCDRSEKILDRMKDLDGDQTRLNPLIDELHAMRKETNALNPGYALVQKINQTGSFNRARADRDIHLAADDPIERQRRQIERDAVNVRWLREAASETARLFDAANHALDGAPKITTSRSETGDEAPRADAPLPALLFFDPEFTPQGAPRRADGTTLRSTLRRLSECRLVERVVIASPDPATARALTVDAPDDLTIDHVNIDPLPLRDARRLVAAARAWAPDAWRGGLGGATCYDELFEPTQLARVMDELHLDAALLVADDWTELDPETCDAVIRRRHENTEKHRVVFSQAAPGRAGIVLARMLVSEFAAAAGAAKAWSSVGGILGYMPFNALADPISRPLCVPVETALRDAALKATSALPSHLIIELTSRRTAGDRTGWFPRASDEARTLDEWTDFLARAARDLPNLAVTFAGRGDPVEHPDAHAVLRAARDAGVAHIHVRTDPSRPVDQLRPLLGLCDVLSLDLLANTAATHERLVADGRYEAAVSAIETLLAERDGRLPWIVPRITRCDATMGEIEGFYDRWLMRAGAAVIDPLPATASDRLAPLTPTPLALQHTRARTLVVDAQGRAATGWDDRSLGEPVADAMNTDLAELWNAVNDARNAG